MNFWKYQVNGNDFILTTKEMVGNAEKVSITYEGLVNDVQVGGTILIDDGLIGLEILLHLREGHILHTVTFHFHNCPFFVLKTFLQIIYNKI